MTGAGRLAVLCITLTVTPGGCTSMEPAPPPAAEVAAAAPQPALYRRLGGREGIALVVDEFVAILAADDRVSWRFKLLSLADVARLKSNAADRLCEASGGPCAYVGRDMRTAHKGMNITGAEWDATVEDLVRAMVNRKVPDPEQQEVLGLLAPLRPEIVAQ